MKQSPHAIFSPAFYKLRVILPVLVALLALVVPTLSNSKQNEQYALDADERIALLLHLAIGQGDVASIKKIIELGAPANASAPNGWTALMRAAANGDHRLVELLLESDADPNLSNGEGLSPLHIATAGGHLAIVNYLIAFGAEIDASGKQAVTPLRIAISAQNRVIVESLLDSGADPNLAGPDGYSPLFQVVQLGYLQLMEPLLNAGANPNHSTNGNTTPLVLAVIQKRTEFILPLLAAGADPNQKSIRGLTAVDIAAATGGKKTQKILERFSGKLAKQSEGKPTLEALAVAIQRGNIDEAKRQVEAGININETLHDDWTLLMFAVLQRQYSLVDFLIERGANPSKSAGNGYTPLHIASLISDKRTAKLLIEAGADVNAKTGSGSTPLDIALERKQKDLATFLISSAGSGSSANKSMIRSVQSMLKLRGFKVGSIDGGAGKNTKAAVRQFQWAMYGTSDGHIDVELYVELRKLINTHGPVGNNWGGVVLDKQSRSIYGTFRKDSRGEALSRALKNCRKKQRGCEVRKTIKNRCVAMARRGKGWAFRIEDTIWKARNAALKGCKKVNPGGCRLTWEFCSDGSFNN